jgi:hypothetical protein
VTLNQSAGALTGVVTTVPGNARAPGVSVTVTNGVLTVQTATESTGNVGGWRVDGLPIPGTYTVTFTRSDLAAQTVSVSLDAAGHITPGSRGALITGSGISVGLQSSTAVVTGTVTQAGGGTVCDPSSDALGEATVTLQSGGSSFTVTTASVKPNCGRFRLEQIPPGTYTMTVTAGSGTSPSSRVITLRAGDELQRDVALPRPASLSGAVFFCAENCTQDKEPRSGWSVFLYLQSQYPAQTVRTATTDASGTFTFDDIDAGKYVVATGPTSDPANATNTVLVTVQPSQQRTGVSLKVSQ